jgi:hypothetical protein
VTEHVQLEIITAVTLIAGQALAIWRAEIAARNAAGANRAAILVGQDAKENRKEQAAAIEQVHQAVNGGMAAQKAEIVSLKEQLVIAKASDAELPPVEQRREEIRGQTS